jgi:RNA polymerase sigma factor (sigma-70 family)
MEKIKTWAVYKAENKKTTRLTFSLEKFLLSQVDTKYRKIALDELINHFIPIVHMIAQRYKWTNISYEDMIAVGIEGIISSADNFDHSKNVRFGTIATHYILGRIRRIIDAESNTIRKPAHINQITAKLNKLDKEIQESDIQELCKDRYTYNQVVLALEHKNQHTVHIEDYLDVPESIERNDDIYHYIQELTTCLTSREKHALSLKFGLDGSEPLTYKELDKELGCDSELVVSRCFKKIRERYQ